MIRPNFRPFKETKYEGHCGKMRQIFSPPCLNGAFDGGMGGRPFVPPPSFPFSFAATKGQGKSTFLPKKSFACNFRDKKNLVWEKGGRMDGPNLPHSFLPGLTCLGFTGWKACFIGAFACPVMCSQSVSLVSSGMVYFSILRLASPPLAPRLAAGRGETTAVLLRSINL